MAKVIIAADKKIKYRIEGTSTWTTLNGGVTHRLNLDFDSSYEFYSSVLSKIIIIGNLDKILISDSTIGDISNSFKNNFFATEIIVNTSGVISDATYAFKNDISLEKLEFNGINELTNTLGMCSGTESISESNKIASSLIRGHGSFEDSNMKTLKTKIINMNEIFMSKNIIVDSSLDLTTLNFNSDSIVNAGKSNVFNSIELLSSGNSILRKKYTKNFNSEVDSEKSIEIDIKGNREFKYETSNNIEQVKLNESIDQSKTIEIDIVPSVVNPLSIANAPKTRRFNTLKNDGYNIEIDVGYKKDIKYETSNDVKIDSIDTAIDSDFKVEIDIKGTTKEDNVAIKVDIPVFNDIIDDNYAIEIDCIPAYTVSS